MKNRTKTTKTQINNVPFVVSGELLLVTLVAGLILASSYGSAETKNASITVSSACTMSTTGAGTYTDTITPGGYSEITGSPLNVVCNDASGYSIYAIGYSNDSYTDNNTKMIASLGSDYNISTATSGSNSWWAMKVAGSGTNTPTIDNSFSSYHEIPATYTKISHVTNNTTNSITTPTYKVNISGTQAPGAYTGKVKYTVVHPNNADAPIPKPDPSATCNTPVTGATYMQDINSSNKSTILAGMTEDAPYYLRDSRDQTPYCVAKLKDGNIWMLDNLALDLTDSNVRAAMYNTTDTKTNATYEELGYLFNGGGSNQYAATGVANWTSDASYTQPLVNLTNKDTVLSDATSQAGQYKVGGYYNFCAASAGTYCWDARNNPSTPSDEQNGVHSIDADICPKGWSIPTGNTNGEYRALYNNASYNTYANYRTALHLPLSGYFLNGSADYQGSRGNFWSSTRYNSYNMYILYLGTSSVYPSDYGGRYIGRSVRCRMGD